MQQTNVGEEYKTRYRKKGIQELGGAGKEGGESELDLIQRSWRAADRERQFYWLWLKQRTAMCKGQAGGPSHLNEGGGGTDYGG